MKHHNLDAAGNVGWRRHIRCCRKGRRRNVGATVYAVERLATNISIPLEHQIKRRTVSSLKVSGCHEQLIVANSKPVLFNAPRDVHSEILLKHVVVSAPVFVECGSGKGVQLEPRDMRKPTQSSHNLVRVGASESFDQSRFLAWNSSCLCPANQLISRPRPFIRTQSAMTTASLDLTDEPDPSTQIDRPSRGSCSPQQGRHQPPPESGRSRRSPPRSQHDLRPHKSPRTFLAVMDVASSQLVGG